MALKIGIVGLPNVGKSTIFNALTKTRSANVENYPFCTIDPNIGVVQVPDTRLDNLSKIYNPVKTVHTVIEFVDIAGLVKGASVGEGLGNKFLSHIRECDAVCQVIRMFVNSNIVHVEGRIDPRSDLQTINTELILADLQSIEKRIQKVSKMAKSNDKELKHQLDILLSVKRGLEAGELGADTGGYNFFLLTQKPFMYISNLSETDIPKFDIIKQKASLGLNEDDILIPVSATLDAELIGFSDEEREEYLQEIGITNSGLDNVITAAYKKLGLITFFTAGPKEVRAWTVRKGATAPEAAGVIHTDFQKGFICAETIKYKELIEAGNEVRARENGCLRREGKDYIVADGDIFHFRFNI